MNHEQRREIALWRYSVLGPLVSARLEYGDRREHFLNAARRIYERPCGRKMRLSPRTIEDWYYAYLRRGLEGLEPRTRSDARKGRALSAEIEDLLIRAKRTRPRRAIRQLIRILVRAGKAAPGQLAPATVHRVLQRAGLPTHRPKVHGDKERRAFLPEHAGDLWVGDVMHGPRVRHDGRLRKTYLVSILDAATRYLVGSTFRLAEAAVDHEAVLRQALRVHGRPRTYYVDRGAAYVSGSLRAICADLGMHLRLTEARDAEAKGSIERWHRTWRAEVGVELEGDVFDLDHLSAVHRAWLAREYHVRVHATTQRAPREHFLAEVSAGHVRALPRGADLDEVFLHRAKRTVRKDNTISFAGRRIEVTRMGMAGRKVELRFDPQDAEVTPKVYLDGSFCCDTRPLDLHANMHRRRKRIQPPEPEHVLSTKELDPVGDLLDEHFGIDLERDDKDGEDDQ
ncbi:MAG: DDE-type integrase/transposase/recombinase [Marinosulfonomonas sp.]|nr:DDE-type integrase/transposase/recombinase [Marinosulfonomonas sp.]